MRTSRVISAIVAVVACSAGCGGGDEPAPDEPREPPQAGSGVAGKLVVTPASAAAGDTIAIVVENTGEVPLLYGLGNEVERRVDGSWEDAAGDVFGERRAVPAIGLIVQPGKRAGPDYGQVSDRITLPSDLESGAYRVRKHVRALRGPGSTTLQATFAVSDPAVDPRR